jgi:serine/threonine protein kinase
VSGTILTAGTSYGGRYCVTGFIGEGGMQEVYLANDTTLARSVALKVPKNRAAERRFQRSAMLSARVNHPNAAKTLDYFDDSDRFYLVEEFIEGVNLSTFRQQFSRLDPYSCARIFHNLAKGTAASHHVNVVHRDLKPSNIMVDGSYQLSTIKITDFGIAKMAEEELGGGVSEQTITSSHTLFGALPYLSPEMCSSPREAGCPADIWALAAIVYELLTGSKPFGSNLAAVPKILAAEFSPFLASDELSPQFCPLADEIFAIISKCFKIIPNERPTADSLVKMCQNLCYHTAPRYLGRVDNYAGSTFGFIRPDDGSDPVFFHSQSVCGVLPGIDSRVWYAKFSGIPRDRAHPVVAICDLS